MTACNIRLPKWPLAGWLQYGGHIADIASFWTGKWYNIRFSKITGRG
jgi:hypothetical protein